MDSRFRGNDEKRTKPPITSLVTPAQAGVQKADGILAALDSRFRGNDEVGGAPMTSKPDIDAAMFDVAPVSLWLEDYSGLKSLFDEWRGAGVTDLRAHLAADPKRVKACSEGIRVVAVNQKTLALFEAADLTQLTADLGSVFRDEMLKSPVEELVQLWDGRVEFSNQGVNYSLSGRRLDILLQGRILPGHEDAWDRVLIVVEDVTERETARRQLAISEEMPAACSSIRRSPSGSRTSAASSVGTPDGIHPLLRRGH